jgi:hypothetical protein
MPDAAMAQTWAIAREFVDGDTGGGRTIGIALR